MFSPLWKLQLILVIPKPLILIVESYNKSAFLHYEKRGVLQLTLQLDYWVPSNTCNSLYLYTRSVNEQVAWVVEFQLTIYTVQLIATQLQVYQNNSFSTIMQLHYNCTHDVMLTSLIVIHLLKFYMWHYRNILRYKIVFFLKYWSQLSIMIVDDGLKLWHVT